MFDTYLVDPILGFLLPGAGDIVGSTLGLYVVALAVRRGVPPIVIARMLMNLAIDAATGVIPLVGDLFDLGFKANTRNLELLEQRTAPGSKGTWRDWAMVGGALLALLAVLALVIVVVAWAVRRVGW